MEGFRVMFESAWNNLTMIGEVTNQIVAQVEKFYREDPPEFVYFLTLYHLFRDSIEDDEYNGIRPGIKFEGSVVWSKFYDFQRDAVVGAIRKLEKYKGCTVVGSISLGKTHEALIVIKYYGERNNRVPVLCPKRLRENWTLWTRGNGDHNPFVEDRFSYDMLNHTDLDHHCGMNDDIDLEHSRWHNYDPLVIDKSHNFRNKSTDTNKKDRYTRLIEDVIKAGIRTKALTLFVTPVNNKLLDLRNQIELTTEGDDEYLVHTDGIPSIIQITHVVQTRFNEWIKRDDSERTTESFVSAADVGYFKLLDVLAIARSRKHIAECYGTEDGTFPTRLKPISFQAPVGTENELPPTGALNDMTAQSTFARHQVLPYVRNDRHSDYKTLYINAWSKDFKSQVNRTKAVANLIRVNMLKRMESSVSNFRITLQRIFDGCVEPKKRLDEIGTSVGYDVDESSFEFDTDDDTEEPEAGGRVRVNLHDVDALRLNQDLEFDIDTLHKLLQCTETVTPGRDIKLLKLREFIVHKVNNPSNPGDRKVLVLGAFADTTDYLFEHLAFWLRREPSIEYARVVGSFARTHSLKPTRTTFENILARLSSISKELPEQMRSPDEIDAIFATDCILEGQNLQNCDCLVNYDIHWNPVCTIQCSGRIDRLGSTNSQIQLVNFWPNVVLDDCIRLRNRVRDRMILLDTSVTGEESMSEYKDKDEMNGLVYRRKQLGQLQNEVLDLEDISDGISITDFAYGDFRVEPQRCAKEHPGLLENFPLGLYAVTSIPDELRGEVEPGIVFCLKQADESVNPQDTNPLLPRYLVYMSDDGEIMTWHTQPKLTLDIVCAIYSGYAKPIADLCHEFNHETRDGTKIGTYTEMLNDVVSAITGIQQDKGTESSFSLDRVGSSVARGLDNYSLICFAVIR